MIISKYVEIKITKNNLRIYSDTKCKIGDIINYPVKNLTLGSHAIIDVKCDYCGKIFKINYNNYNNKTKNGKSTTCCNDVKCMKQKRLLATQEKYGVDNVFQLEDIKEKMKNTNLERYGVENPHQNEEIKIKVDNTNLIRYGCKNVFQNEEIKDKIRETNLKNLGVEYPTQCESVKDKIRKTNFKNYGFDYPSQNQDYFNKHKNNGFKLTYFDDLFCQGSYENDFVLKYKDIIKIENGLSLKYNYLGQTRIYHSDFYLPDYDLIIEIKSSYWYNVHLEQCKAKEEYSKKEHNYIMIMNKKYAEFDKLLKF